MSLMNGNINLDCLRAWERDFCVLEPDSDHAVDYIADGGDFNDLLMLERMAADVANEFIERMMKQ